MAQEDDSQAPLRHTKGPTTVASFRTWRGSRDFVAQDPAIKPLVATLAERVGFEPTVRLVSVHTISSRAPSASRAPLLVLYRGFIPPQPLIDNPKQEYDTIACYSPWPGLTMFPLISILAGLFWAVPLEDQALRVNQALTDDGTGASQL